MRDASVATRSAMVRRAHLTLLAGAVLVAAPSASAQEAGHAAGEHAEASGEHELRHAVSVFLGGATHTRVDETGFAVGLSYGYRLTPRWILEVKAEYASSDLERDRILMGGIAFLPVPGFELAGMVGVERATIEEVEEGDDGASREVDETEFLFRAGIGYGIPLGGRFELVPEFSIDITSRDVTLVYGFAFSVGL